MSDRPLRILLADDEQAIQTLLSYPLQKDGYEVVRASNGREALARFEEQTFDLVVLDVMMPRIDGLEVCRRLRARSSVLGHARAARRSRQARRGGSRRGDHADLRRVRDPARARSLPRPRVHARHAAHAHLGRLRLSRPAHDRRPHPPPAREARDRREGARVPVHRARRGLFPRWPRTTRGWSCGCPAGRSRRCATPSASPR